MEESKHTPGPWFLDHLKVKASAKDGTVYTETVASVHNNFSLSIAEANAALIAAAPETAAERDTLREINAELLAALKGLIGQSPQDCDATGICRHCGRDNGGYTDRHCIDVCPGQIARAAIAKAEGRT